MVLLKSADISFQFQVDAELIFILCFTHIAREDESTDSFIQRNLLKNMNEIITSFSVQYIGTY